MFELLVPNVSVGHVMNPHTHSWYGRRVAVIAQSPRMSAVELVGRAMAPHRMPSTPRAQLPPIPQPSRPSVQVTFEVIAVKWIGLFVIVSGCRTRTRTCPLMNHKRADVREIRLCFQVHKLKSAMSMKRECRCPNQMSKAFQHDKENPIIPA